MPTDLQGPVLNIAEPKLAAVVPQDRRHQRTGRIDAALIVGIGLMIALCAGLLWDARTRALQVAERDEAVVAEILASRMGHDIESLSLSINGAARTVQLPGIWDISPDLRQTALFDASLKIKSLAALGIVDQDGNMRQVSNTLSPPAFNVRGGDYYEYHRTHPDPGIHFSGPRMSRYSGQQVIILSKRLNDAHGNFAGVAVGSLNVAYYENLFGQMALPQGAIVGLTTTDGRVVARVPFDSRTLTSNISQSSLFSRAQHASSGNFTEVSPVDHIERLVTYQRLADSPFIVFYARATGEILTDWWHAAFWVGAGTLLLCGLKVVLVWQLRRERLRRESAEQHARLSAQVLALVNRDLEDRVQQEVQSREEVYEQLAASQRQEALGQLAGGIAHDINNVLQTICGACSMLQVRHRGNEAITRLAGTALSAADRGSAITRRLLVFARRAPVRVETVDVLSLLGDLQEVLSHTLGGHVLVQVDVAANLPRISVDRMQLETVIINLATNARDAMPQGGDITIAARLETVQPGRPHRIDLAPGEYVRLSVADTGTGMDTATLKHATEPFFSTKGPSHGTGLGLSMAKGFAEQSKGQLDIMSAPGKGTTVSLWLPKLPDSVEAALSLPSLDAPQDKPNRLSGSRILIVDDEDEGRKLVAEWLQAAGFSVLQAASGAAALFMLETEGTVDLLLTDLSMPKMDGVELIQQVRQGWPAMPVILLTGHLGAVASLAIEQKVGGKCLVLQKPIRIGDLQDSVELALKASAVTLSGLGVVLAHI